MKAYQMVTRIKEHFSQKKQSSGDTALQLKITRTAADQNYTCPKLFPFEHVKRQNEMWKKETLYCGVVQSGITLPDYCGIKEWHSSLWSTSQINDIVLHCILHQIPNRPHHHPSISLCSSLSHQEHVRTRGDSLDCKSNPWPICLKHNNGFFSPSHVALYQKNKNNICKQNLIKIFDHFVLFNRLWRTIYKGPHLEPK